MFAGRKPAKKPRPPAPKLVEPGIPPSSVLIEIRCVPPSTTAQQGKRQVMVKGKPMFFKDDKIVREEQTWAALISPYRLPAPILGPVECTIRLVYPHLKSVKAKDREFFYPKDSKPDADNAAKALVDLFSKLRFVDDDKQIASFAITKFRGPESSVGIRIELRPMPNRYRLASNGALVHFAT